MKDLFLVFFCTLFILGCGTHNLREFKPIVKTEKSITVPPGGFMLTGAIKDSLKRDNWVLYVDTAHVVHKGESGPTVNITSKEAFKTRYRLRVEYQQFDICIPGGHDNPALYYDVAITDNSDESEVMNFSGRGCQSAIVEKFNEWLKK